MIKPNHFSLISHIVENGKDRKWIELAEMFNIKPFGTIDQRRKSANDIWRAYLKRNQNPQQSITPKRLFYDIETSYNIVRAWRAGYNQTIRPEDILQERAIICISYKWQGDDKIHTLKWDEGDDTLLVERFVDILEQADEIVGHNIDRFDTKYVMTRAINAGVMALPKYNSHDTLKIAKKHFMFNSNKLDYIAQFLGIGSKIKHRGMDMWDDIILNNCPKAMKEMVDYCEKDVLITEEVYYALSKYTETKMHHGVLNGREKSTCPNCGNNDSHLVKTSTTKAGTIKRLMSCGNCDMKFTFSNRDYLKIYE